MKIYADYHTHTQYSHGLGTLEENVIIAIQKGLRQIAITDHGPSYSPYGIKSGDFKRMRVTVKRLQEKYAGTIEILLGIEANILDTQGTLDVDDSILKDCDILLAGFHYDISYIELLKNIRSQLKRHQSIKPFLEPNLYKEIAAINSEAMVKSLCKYDIDILTHPGDNQPINIANIAQLASSKGTALEINNFHRYLTTAQIKEAESISEVSFVLCSDAHRPQDVGNFIGARKRVEQSGLDLRRIRNVL